MIIMRDLDDPRIKMAPVITKVETLEDLSVANVYVSIMGTPGQQSAALNALKHSAGLMRTKLAKMLTIRQMPFLQFHIDEGHRKEIEILELLHKLEVERQEKESLHRGGTEPRSEDDATTRDANGDEGMEGKPSIP
jgi:ribosome-binding factor A